MSPVFFLGLLATLLLISHPTSWLEWGFISVCVASLLPWVRGSASLVDQTVLASAAFFVGAFTCLALLRVRSLFARSMGALLFATAATVVWYLVYHIHFDAVQNEIVTKTWEAWRLMDGAGLPPPPPLDGSLDDGAVTDQSRNFAAMIAYASVLFPAWIALIALASARISWSWYQRIARTPVLPPAKPLREFRFNDHLIWALVVLVIPFLMPAPDWLKITAGNALAVVGSLYFLRGFAVTRSALQRASPLFIALLLLIMLPFFYIVPFGFATVGIADTWLDFRRRPAPPTGASP